MGGNTFGYRQPENTGTYWRRRFIILTIGFAIFGLAAWGVSTALAVSTGAAGSAGTSHPGKPGPGSAGRIREHARVRAAPLPNTSTDASASKLVSRAGQDQAGQDQPGQDQPGQDQPGPGRVGGGQATGHGEILPAFCGRRDIVLSLFTGQMQFGPRQWPAFDVTVVSTQEAECTFNIGSRHLALLIKEGPALIWNSADCAAGAGALDAALRRGIPTVLPISWNRQTSAPGCAGRTTRARPGTYTAYAAEGDLTSQPVTFRLT